LADDILAARHNRLCITGEQLRAYAIVGFRRASIALVNLGFGLLAGEHIAAVVAALLGGVLRRQRLGFGLAVDLGAFVTRGRFGRAVLLRDYVSRGRAA
jgi:hypothetical protein